MNENSQQTFDFTPLPTFLVGCRVAGEIQHFHVEAVEQHQARSIVKQGVDGANPIFVRVK
jgi:hypothetical protein